MWPVHELQPSPSDHFLTAAVMSLIQTAKLNAHNPYAYIKDVPTRLRTHKNGQIGELLSYRLQPTPLHSTPLHSTPL